MTKISTHVNGKELLKPVILYVYCSEDFELDSKGFFAISEKHKINVVGEGDTADKAVKNFGISMLGHYKALKYVDIKNLTASEIIERILLDDIIGENFNG